MNGLRVAAKIQPARQTIIFLHGLGDTGSGWGFLAQYLQQRDPAAFQHTNFVFPNAPELHVTANGGALMPAWFDILEWDPSFSKVDSDGFMNSLNSIEKTVKQEIDKGIKPEHIIIGGFSQGAALALATSVTLPWKIGGIVALSGFCSIPGILKQHKNGINVKTPIFHGHGDMDPVVPIGLGIKAKQFYQDSCEIQNYEFKVYKGMAHSTVPDELEDLASFIKKSLSS
ncbi:BFP_1a_G0035860.mRNA.1.CDS.1 [Saccharomyces cerevisiae]|nr:BFP_1a_G0035860.mRNA.1.CDS.1 [Saccharomyces cerevisiae]CAI7230127.1 BFP_1a_G0035860.mRNA.1.CDS.1 [Saccharomyces cerevisiae]